MEKGKSPELNTRQIVESETRKNLQHEKEFGWPTYESGLIGNMGGPSYSSTFHSLCPEKYKNIKDYIEKFLKEKTGHAVGLEVGGTGSNLFADFTKGFIEESLSVAIGDGTSSSQKENNRDINHSILLSNALVPFGFKEIKGKLKNKKVNVLFERMLGGIVDMPGDLKYWKSMFSLYYSLLDDKALMFIETPGFNYLEGEELKKILSNLNLVPGISVDYKDDLGNSFYIRIQKDKNAPADLRAYFK